ncbi:hypothetical protein A7U60_g8054 [Sanghuangporus baumii]|uniref:Uncharacterized protein n=1 Tax=Sanghuangporus baumii TaxID=108892 RepID=A0A9Q5HRY1_SANBA|nr:hypothetical protein A7U60_g8054 [Sanghuangporus baumii]
MPVDALRKRKIAVLGSRSVGKSSLVIQFVEDHFVESYYPTIESTFRKDIKHNGVVYECDIIDTAGQDEYSILNAKHAVGIHGFVLVYSVVSRNSFDMVQIIHEKIVTFTGNQQVSKEEAEEFAKSIGASSVETSAKKNINVPLVFDLVLGEIEKRAPHNQNQPATKGCFIQ